jgi:hypothetical protein
MLNECHERARGSWLVYRVYSVSSDYIFNTDLPRGGLPLWSSSQSVWQLTQRTRVRFPALPDFLSSSGSGTGVHSALVRINEEFLERKLAAPV